MNRTPAIMTLLLILFAGCTDAPDTDATDPVPQDTPGDDPGIATMPPGTDLELAVTAPNGPLRNGTWLVQGTVSDTARVSFRLMDGNESTDLGGLDADDAWSHEIEVPYGQSILVTTADDGTGAVSIQTPLVRLAQASLQVRYGGYPGHTDHEDTVWLDVDAFPSMPLYEEAGADHPDYANIHDLMVQWETDTDHTVAYSYIQDFGFAVDSIDGAGNPITSSAPPWWCYTIDGEGADLGITLQPFEPDTTVTWVLGTCTET